MAIYNLTSLQLRGAGILNSFDIPSGSEPSIDPDAQAFITATGITDPTIETAINTLVVDLKGFSIWAKLDVILPIVGGSATSHRYDLKSATTKVSWIGGITHNSTGVKFNGTTGYGDVSWQAPNLYDRTAVEWTKDVVLGIEGWNGIFSGAVFGMQLRKIGANLETVSVGLNTLGAINQISSFGIRASVVESSGTNGGKHYGGSGLLYQATPSSNPPASTYNYFVGALNASGSPIIFGQQTQQFYAFGNALDATEVANLNTAISTYQTALGR